jgi:hypothetical protein
MIENLEIISLSIKDNYLELKDKPGAWEIYLSGVSFGVYNMSDKSFSLDQIYSYLENSVLSKLN